MIVLFSCGFAFLVAALNCLLCSLFVEIMLRWFLLVNFLHIQSHVFAFASILLMVFLGQVIQMNVEESARRQIAQELKINQSSQCPYVVVCYQSFYDNGAISIILEYMDGGSLADFLKKVRTIPEPYLAAISKQVGTKVNHVCHNIIVICCRYQFIKVFLLSFYQML